MDINNLCPKCMRESETEITKTGKCPCCGFNAATYRQNARCLPLYTILAGKYLVGAVLGEGGFGITYMGYDLNMETRIAIKEYFPVELVSRDTTSMTGDRVISMGGDKSAAYKQGLKKYVTEAQSVSRFSETPGVSRFSETPGVVSVKDFFYENETAYIVMEYIEGISLKEYLKEQEGRLSEEESLAIMKPVLEALVKVHEAGIIHRDISPDNIMLTFSDGQTTENAGKAASDSRRIESVKLIDFGAARMTAKEDQKSLTIILKHGYAPEEQYRTHGEQGPWTDVYAVCAVLYRMLTGETPVPAMDRLFQDTLKSFDSLNTKVAKNIQAVILKGLAVKKENRIQDMGELYHALYEGKRLKKTGSSIIMKRLAGGSAVLAVIAGIAFTWMIFRGSDNQGTALRTEGGAAETKTETGVEETTGNETVSQEETVSKSEDSAIPEPGEMAVSLEFEEEEEVFGEVIVTANPQTGVASGESHMLFRKEDGTVISLGANEYGQREVTEWKRIAAVAGGDCFSAGLREDGRVLIAGELESRDEVESWQDIVAIAATREFLFGLTKEGTIRSNMNFGGRSDYYDWVGIKAIAASQGSFCALTSEGEVRTVPFWDAESPLPVSGWTDVEQIICAQYSVFGITGEGDVRCALIFEDATGGSHNFDNMELFHDIVQLYSDAGMYQYGVARDGTVCLGGFGFEPSPYAAERLCGPAMGQWTDMAGITGMEYDERYAGLKKDGSLVTIIENYGNSTPESMENMEWITEVDKGNLIGTTRDGQLQMYGTDLDFSYNMSSIKDVHKVVTLRGAYPCYITWNGSGQVKPYREIAFPEGDGPEYFCWDDCIQLEGEREGAYCVGLMADGSVRMAYARPSYEENMPGLARAEEWEGIIQVAVEHTHNSSCIYGLREDGTVISAEWLEGVWNETTDWKDIAAVFSGYDCIGAVRKDGSVIFSNLEDNTHGQKNTAGWTDIIQLAPGHYHTAGLKSDGTVVAVGSNLSGQCDVEDWTDIVYVEAGDNCTIGISSDGKLVVAGEVGW